MKVGVISDTHDRIANTKKALAILNEKGIRVLIHCGDFCAPFMMNEMKENFEGEIHCVFGNIDDRFMTPDRALSLGINFHGDTLEIEFEGRKIAANHYPNIAESLAHTKKYDAVFYGHNHTADKKKIGKTLLANPGEIMGWKGRVSFGIYDTNTNDLEHIDIENPSEV